MYIVAGLMKDAHQARGLIRALADAAFEREEIDMSGGPIAGLLNCGLPDDEAHVFAEGVRRGGVIVAVKADDEMEAEQAALLMSRHAYLFGDYPGGAGRIYRDPRTVPSPSERTPGAQPGGPYEGPERRRVDKPYVGVNRRAV